MKKIFTFVITLGLGLTGAVAQTATPVTTPPVVPVTPALAPNQKMVTDGALISFAESKHDFGTIKEGEVVTHTFKFKNTGNQPLVISQVKVTCGCTTPDWTKTPVAPGQYGFITAQFNSTGKPGQNHKVITVVSNSVTGNTPLSFVTNVLPRETAASSVK